MDALVGDRSPAPQLDSHILGFSLHTLPDEIILEILNFLSPPTLWSIRRVSANLRRLASHDRLWNSTLRDEPIPDRIRLNDSLSPFSKWSTFQQMTAQCAINGWLGAGRISISDLWTRFSKRNPEGLPYPLKVVVVGDDNVGRSSLCVRLSTGGLDVPEEERRYGGRKISVREPFEISVGCCGGFFPQNQETFKMTIWDTTPDTFDYCRLRPLAYPMSDVALCCFDVSNRDSFHRVFSQWIPEVRHCAEGALCVVAGLKSDLRDGLEEDFVSREEAVRMSIREKAAFYCEASSTTQDGLSGLVLICALCAMMKRFPELVPSEKEKRCSVM